MQKKRLAEPLLGGSEHGRNWCDSQQLLRLLGMGGHPLGLPVLFFTEMWERFSFFGLTSLLVLYLNDGILESTRLPTVLGGPLLIHIFGQPSSTSEIQTLSTYIFGGYTGAAYMLPLAGGALADRVLGHRLTMLIGGSLMAMGHCAMTVEYTFLPGLLLAAFGNGAFKPNVSAQLGMLYEAPGGASKLRDRGFGIFYAGINIGATLAPLVCGYLQHAYGYSAAFGAAGVGMVGGLSIYCLGMHHTIARASAPLSISPPPAGFGFSSPPERRCCTPKQQLGVRRSMSVLALCLLTIPFWIAYAQTGSTLQLYFDRRTDRTIGGFVVPSPWLQAVNPILCTVLIGPIQRLWAWQAARHSEPSSDLKMATGSLLVAIAFSILALGSRVFGVDAGADAPMPLIALSVVVLTIGELYLSPVGLSLISRCAAGAGTSTGLGLWFLATGIADVLSGALAALYTNWSMFAFFSLCAVLATISAVLLYCLTELLQQAALAERTLLGFPLSPTASPTSSPKASFASDLDTIAGPRTTLPTTLDTVLSVSPR
mmetsp:Transcript_45055/g.89989  ORF Transcript_45055/g.89989 Transcript_45055/m.89989 type:complete len:541 (-) Transcript_45055:17-1639(-)